MVALTADEINKRNANRFGPYCYNVVATADLQCQFDVRKITKALRGRWISESFPATCTHGLAGFTEKTLIFKAGTALVVGASTREHALLHLRQIAWLIENRTDYKVSLTDFRVNNLQAILNTGYKINLDLFAELNPRAVYEKRDIGCARFKFRNSTVAFLVWPDGNINITGCSRPEQLLEYSERILQLTAYCMTESLTKLEQNNARRKAEADMKVAKEAAKLSRVEKHAEQRRIRAASRRPAQLECDVMTLTEAVQLARKHHTISSWAYLCRKCRFTENDQLRILERLAIYEDCKPFLEQLSVYNGSSL